MSLDVRLRRRLGAFELDVAFDVPATGVTALYGPSGAGKSSILDVIAGLARPDAGHVILDGTPLTDTAARIHVPAHQRRIGCVFQDARLFPHLDVRANLDFGRRRQARPVDRAEADALIDLLELRALLDRRPATLSGGERQRVAIGRALLSSPRLLLLDEPLAALDPARRSEVLGRLERLRDRGGVPLLYVSHREDEIARLADHVVMIDAGRVVGSAPVAEALASPGFTDHFHTAPTTVVAARVREVLEDWDLTVLDSPLGTLTVPRVAAAPGDAVRLGISADDVMLAREAAPLLGEMSANNVFEGRVDALHAAGGPWTDVTLRCGEQALVARITRRSAGRLGLAEGATVTALVKAATVHR